MLLCVVDKVAQEALELLVRTLQKGRPRRAAVVGGCAAHAGGLSKAAENGARADIGESEEAGIGRLAMRGRVASFTVVVAVVQAEEAARRGVDRAGTAAAAAAAVAFFNFQAAGTRLFVPVAVFGGGVVARAAAGHGRAAFVVKEPHSVVRAEKESGMGWDGLGL